MNDSSETNSFRRCNDSVNSRFTSATKVDIVLLQCYDNINQINKSAQFPAV